MPPRIIAIDTETELIRPGLMAPPLVCLSWSLNTSTMATSLLHEMPESGLFDHKDAPLAVLHWFAEGYTFTGLNLAYDFAVLAAEQPSLLPFIFDGYARDQVADVGIRQKLIDIARGEYRGKYDADSGAYISHEYSVAALSERFLGKERSDKDEWQLKFGELRGVPLDEWPQGAKDYALADAEDPLIIYNQQEEHSGLLKDQFRQSQHAFWIHLMSCWGLRTSAPAIDSFEVATKAKFEEAVRVCKAAGLVRDNGSRDTKKAKQLMMDVCEKLDIQPNRTPTYVKLRRKRDMPGAELTAKDLKNLQDPMFGISLDEEACLGTASPVLKAYSEVSSLKVVVEKQIPQLRNGIRTPIQPRFDSLISSGRTACKGHSDNSPTNGYQVHNVRRLPGIRETFVPRRGNVYLSSDYDGLELRTVSQVCIWLTGGSRLAQALNEGVDVHTSLAAQLLRRAYEECVRLRKTGDKTVGDARQFAKIGNFGFWGGMRAKAFQAHARKPANGGVIKSIQECEELHEAWHVNWPESVEYFRIIKNICANGLGSVEQFGSGRHRGLIPFTVCANTFFQGLGADATKAAGFEISRECYTDRNSPLFGARMVNYVHDEFILEVKDSPSVYRPAAERLREIMVREAGKWLPDVPPSATPCVSRCWSKKAEPTYNDNGELIPWT